MIWLKFVRVKIAVLCIIFSSVFVQIPIFLFGLFLFLLVAMMNGGVKQLVYVSFCFAIEHDIDFYISFLGIAQMGTRFLLLSLACRIVRRNTSNSPNHASYTCVWNSVAPDNLLGRSCHFHWTRTA